MNPHHNVAGSPKHFFQQNRRSIRLKGYDYSHVGAYFVTVCTQNRKCLFGNISHGFMALNDAGRIVAEEWLKSGDIRKEIELDEFVIMPNHIHAIVFIVQNDNANTRLRTTGDQPSGPTPRSIGSLIAGFKSVVTKRINTLYKSSGARIWQRNYYEHVIRNENELNRIRQYIKNNPIQTVRATGGRP